MRAAAPRDVLREANGHTSRILATVAEPLEAALKNELLTRGRVEQIERILRRAFWGRLYWLLTGK